MTIVVIAFNCTEIAKSIVWPHGDCLVVFSNSSYWLPTKLILLKENCEIPFGFFGCSVRSEVETVGCSYCSDIVEEEY